MSRPNVHRYVDDLLRGRRPKPFQPDDFDVAQLRTAIDLQAARPGGDRPREEFLADLQRRLATQLETPTTTVPSATRRQVIVGTSAAAAAAVVAVTADRMLSRNDDRGAATAEQQELAPSRGSWQPVAAVDDVPEGVMHPFEVGSLVGFVRRVDGRAEAISGVCTHQGCRLWFDGPDDRLRCPCHSTWFSPQGQGQVLTHQLPIGPKPLPRLQVREANGVIEVFAPTEPA